MQNVSSSFDIRFPNWMNEWKWFDGVKGEYKINLYSLRFFSFHFLASSSNLINWIHIQYHYLPIQNAIWYAVGIFIAILFVRTRMKTKVKHHFRLLHISISLLLLFLCMLNVLDAIFVNQEIKNTSQTSIIRSISCLVTYLEYRWDKFG